MKRILLVGACPEVQGRILSSLEGRYKVHCEKTPGEAMAAIAANRTDLVLLCEEGENSLSGSVLSAIRQSPDSHLPLIILAREFEASRAVEAMHAGAIDFLPLDLAGELLSLKVRRALEQREVLIHLRGLQQGLLEQQHRFVFASDAMKGVNFEITRLAALDYDVLLTGETGVGKDLIATLIHARSARSNKPFVSIPLRSLSESLIESELFGHEKGSFSSANHFKMGKFEAANGGTIYIPEISCLTEVVQLKLLYFMQYKRISRVGQDPHKPEINLSVRVVVATNDNLEALVDSGRIREDFYHRIAGVQLSIPPLRERIDDVLPLAEYFLETFSGAPRGVRFDFSPEVADLLRSYHWPGNVRQLENAIKSAIAFSNGSILGPREFAHSVRLTKHAGGNSNSNSHNQTMPLVFDQAENLFKHQYFAQLMAAADHSVPRAASLSGLTPQWIRKMIKWLGIHKSPKTFVALFVFVETLVS